MLERPLDSERNVRYLWDSKHKHRIPQTSLLKTHGRSKRETGNQLWTWLLKNCVEHVQKNGMN